MVVDSSPILYQIFSHGARVQVKEKNIYPNQFMGGASAPKVSDCQIKSLHYVNLFFLDITFV